MKKITVLMLVICSLASAQVSSFTIQTGATVNITHDGTNGAYLIHDQSFPPGDLIVVGAINTWAPGALINWKVTGDGDISLPVQLTDFKGVFNNGIVELSWTTATEVNNMGFNIYRKTTNTEYININEELIAGAINSSTQNNYEFRDTEIRGNEHYTYLLEDVSTDNEVKKHHDLVFTIQVPDIAENSPETYDLLPAYPNPFNPTTTIGYRIPKDSDVKVTIYDISGQKVETLVNTTQASGNYTITWNASNYSSGVYFYRLQAAGFSELKKCMLVK